MRRTNAPLSTKAKRKAMAKTVSQAATEALGFPVELTPCEYDPTEWRVELGKYETDRGPVDYLRFEVCPRMVTIYSRFGMPEFGPHGVNPHSGKWNHHISPDMAHTPAEFREYIRVAVGRVLEYLRPLPGVVRADRPGRDDQFQAYISEMRSEAA